MATALNVPTLYLFAFLLSTGGVYCLRAQATAHVEGFPPRDVKVQRTWVTSQTLRLRFEPAPSLADKLSGGRSATYVIAASPKTPPRVTLVGGHFYRMAGNEVIGESYAPSPDVDFQGALTRVSNLGLYRHYQIYALNVNFAINAKPLYPTRVETWFADFVEFEIDLGAPVSTPISTVSGTQTSAAPAPTALDEALLLNPDISSAYYVTTSPRTWDEVLQWGERLQQGADARALFKLIVYKPGFYRVSQADLKAACAATLGTGASAELPPARNWRVLVQGKEVAAIESPVAPDDELFLLIPQWDIDEDGPTAVWVETRSSEPSSNRPLRLEMHGGSQNSEKLPSVASCELVAERLEDYQVRINPTAEVTHWFWKSIAPQTIETFPIELPSSFNPSGKMELTVYGALSFSRQKLPFLELLAQGGSLATAALSSVQGTARFQIEQSALRQGNNNVGLKLCYTDEGEEEKRDFLVQKFVLRWPQVLDRLPGAPFSLASSERELTCQFSETTAPVLLGTLEPYQTWVGLVSPKKKMTFRDYPVGRNFIATSLASVPSPAAITLATTSAAQLLRPSVGADYLAIAHPSLLEAAKPLLERRQRQGLSTALVNVEDVFDLFGFGQHHSKSIRNFLTYAFYHWPAPQLERVLLLGEASDYRRDPAEASPKVQLDMIPTGGSVRTQSVHGDHPYACVAGADSVPDLQVGRISVATAAELTSAIAKLIRYEMQPQEEWAQRAILVTDDNEEFPRVAAEVAAVASAPPLNVTIFNEANYLYVPNPRVYGKRRSRDATQELINKLNAGLLFVNYFGHGGPNIWSHERLLHILDLPKLTEPARLPLIACASCDNAWLDYPVPPVKASMGELFVKKPEGGAVAVFAPVSGATPYEHQHLMTFLLEGMTRTPLETVGELASYAKICYYAQTLSPAVPEQYVVVGDPALKLHLRKAQEGLLVEPCAVAAKRPNSVSVTASHLPETLTSATLTLTAIDTSDEVLSRPVAVIKGKAAAVVSLPELEPGPYAFALHYSEHETTPPLIGRLDVTVPRVALDEAKLVALASRAIPTTETVRTCVSLLNASALGPLPATLYATLGDETNSDALSVIPFRDFRIPAGGAYEQVFKWLPSLPKRLTVRWHTADVKQETGIFTYELPRVDAQTSTSYAVPYGCKIVAPETPTEFDPPTLACEIWNVGTEESPDDLVTILASGELLAQSQRLAKLAPQTKRPMTFVCKKPLPPGITTVTLVIQRQELATSSSGHWQTVYERTDPVRIFRAPDIEIVPGSVRADVPPEGIIARTSVRIRALIRNNGEVAARNVRYQLMLDDPTTGTAAVMLNDERAGIIREIPPGATIPLEARWENCSEPGTPNLWLVVNGAKTVKEPNYANNVAAVPSFKVRRLGDFRALALDVSPRECAEGTTVVLQCAVSSDADVARGPLDIEIGMRNPITHVSESEHLVLDTIASATTTTLRAVLPYRPDFTEAYAIVNSSKELEELDSGGDEVVTPMTPIIELKEEPARGHVTELDLSSDFARALSYNVEWVPGPALRLSETPTSSTGLLPAMPEWAVGGDFIPRPIGAAGEHDNKWTVAPWLIEAHPTEQCAPLQLRVPVAPWLPDTPYDVYVYLPPVAPSKGSKSLGFELAVESSPRIVVSAQTWKDTGNLQRRYLTRTQPQNAWLDLTIYQTSGTAAILKGVEIVPVAGVVDSPIYLMPESPRGAHKLTFIDSDPDGSAVKYWVRSGTTALGSAIAWRDWTPVVNKSAQLDPRANVFQWRAMLLPSEKQLRPTLKRVLLIKGQ
jgi:hypothetical protein